MDRQTCMSDGDMGRLWEGDVSPEERQAFERHMEACPRCRDRWAQTLKGASRIEEVARLNNEQPTIAACPSPDLLGGYISGRLDEPQTRVVEEHLAVCSWCRATVSEARRFYEDYDGEGRALRARAAAWQALCLFAQVPGRIDLLLNAVGTQRPGNVQQGYVVTLPALRPLQGSVLRLAAGTGEGFSRQTIRQDEPLFELDLAQFGDELRVTARALEEHSPYAYCLARLEFLEGKRCRLARVVLIDKGNGQCILSPEDVRQARPERGDLGLRLSPLVTMEQVADAGTEAYVPILSKLLRDESPSIRRAAIQVLGRIGGSEVRALIKPLGDDPDESVRSAARLTLARLLGEAQ